MGQAQCIPPSHPKKIQQFFCFNNTVFFSYQQPLNTYFIQNHQEILNNLHTNWRPSASIETLLLRANVLAKIRRFFAERNILEVETPLLSTSTISDPNLHSISAHHHQPGAQNSQTLYLQTSPEFAMKRLLAAGSGSIYQICKAFRDEECGNLHQPEFTMLEWYRIDFDHHTLMNEMDEFLNFILSTPKAERLSYTEMFQKYLGINPHLDTVEKMQLCAKQNDLNISTECYNDHNRDLWLQTLLINLIEPNLGQERPTFIYDFPVTQAALARISQDNCPTAERFEVYIKGMELANGFHELADVDEQRARFYNDLAKRDALKLPKIPLDENLLAALAHGLPDCSGVALGIDRLIMLASNMNSIVDVIAFDLTGN